MEGPRPARSTLISYAESDDSDTPTSKQLPISNDTYNDEGAEDEDELEFDEGHYIGQPSNQYEENEEDEDEELDDNTGYAPAPAENRNTRGYALRTKPNVSLKGSESAMTKRALNPKGNKIKAKRGAYKKKNKGKGSSAKGMLP